VLAAADLVARFGAVQPLWPVSTPALAAALACASEVAVAEEARLAARLAVDRAHLVDRLAWVAGVHLAAPPAASFVLVRVAAGGAVRVALRERGYAVRRGDTFPGLGPDWLRIAVRDPATTDAFIAALGDAMADVTARS
jgi:histidinol-phosphate aminotransferase